MIVEWAPISGKGRTVADQPSCFVNADHDENHDDDPDYSDDAVAYDDVADDELLLLMMLLLMILLLLMMLLMILLLLMVMTTTTIIMQKWEWLLLLHCNSTHFLPALITWPFENSSTDIL